MICSFVPNRVIVSFAASIPRIDTGNFLRSMYSVVGSSEPNRLTVHMCKCQLMDALLNLPSMSGFVRGLESQ